MCVTSGRNRDIITLYSQAESQCAIGFGANCPPAALWVYKCYYFVNDATWK